MRILPAGPPLPSWQRFTEALHRALHPPRTAMEFMEAVVISERRGQSLSAGYLCEAGLQRHPHDFYLLMKRIAQIGAGADLQTTASLLERAAAICPPTAATLSSVGEEYARRRDMARAEDYFRRALERMPNNSPVREKLAMALIQQERLDEGLAEALSAAMDAEPENAERRDLLVKTLLHAGEYQRVIDLLSGVEELPWEHLMALSIAQAQLDGAPLTAESLLHPSGSPDSAGPQQP